METTPPFTSEQQAQSQKRARQATSHFAVSSNHKGSERGVFNSRAHTCKDLQGGAPQAGGGRREEVGGGHQEAAQQSLWLSTGITPALHFVARNASTIRKRGQAPRGSDAESGHDSKFRLRVEVRSGNAGHFKLGPFQGKNAKQSVRGNEKFSGNAGFAPKLKLRQQQEE
eukprot:1155050-Pelagomonas_calceolata.AAC.1